MLGYTGAHRTGKTTLAKEVAQRLDIPVLLTSATEIYKALGRDPKADYPIDERIAIQEAILYGFEKQYKAASEVSRHFVADRTPIDLAGYLMADVTRTTFSDFEDPQRTAMLVNDYVSRCIDSTNRWFSTVILVQPGIVTIEAAGKAPGCPAYMEHLNLLMGGVLHDGRVLARSFRMPRRVTNLEERAQASLDAMMKATRADEARHQAISEGLITLH